METKQILFYLQYYLFQFHMNSLANFLSPVASPQLFPSSLHTFKLTVGSCSFQAQFNGQLQIKVSGETSNEVHIFKPSCLLSPAYSGKEIKKIGICSGNFVMNIDGDSQSIKHLYSKLCRVMGHKGFNDFYKPIKRLGRGTFATVYLVEHKYTGMRRAAKVFSKVGQNIEFMGKEALENQIKTLREIDHPNLIRYDGLYETDSLVYLVTEYLSGGTLEETLKAKTSHTGELIQTIIRDILSGLAYLDERDIMHRDLKPQNIILRQEDGKWVIGDFGLAARSNEDYIYDKCGTMGYIAPEIMDLSENEKYAQACDTYSLGVIAYQLIVGELPFRVEAENFFDKKLVWVLFQRPQCKNIHASILDFLEGLLEKNPATRLSPFQALKSPFFTDRGVINELYSFHQKKRQARYDRILKMANPN